MNWLDNLLGYTTAVYQEALENERVAMDDYQLDKIKARKTNPKPNKTRSVPNNF